MKKLAVVLALMILATPAYASGKKAVYGPNVDPTTVANQWDGFNQITPFCNAKVGLPNSSNLPAWNTCYNCEREEWARKWNIQYEIDTYSALCPN